MTFLRSCLDASACFIVTALACGVLILIARIITALACGVLILIARIIGRGR